MTTMKWRCKICGYIHEGPEPPEACPVCGAPKSEFELVREEASLSAGPEVTGPSAASVVPLATDAEGVDAALASLTYGLFIVSSKKDGSFNAQTANTVFQITSKPPRVALGINKDSLTHEYIRASGEIAITILGRGNLGLVKRFGLQARQTDDPALKEMFEDQARSEMGHVNIFQSLIRDIEECNFL